MRFKFGTWMLILLVVFTAASAKPSLPIELTSQPLPEGRVSLKVTFTKGATDVTVTVRATGTAGMQPMTRRVARVAKGETLEFAPIQTVEETFGGVAVHVRGDFGSGLQVRTQTLTLTEAPSTPASVRARKQADGQNSPDVIILPAKTTVKPLER